MSSFSVFHDGAAYHFSTTWLTPGRIMRVWCRDSMVLLVVDKDERVVAGDMVGWN